MTIEIASEITPSESVRSSRLVNLAGSVWFWFAVALVIRLLYLLEQAGTSPLFYVPLLDEQEVMDSARALLNGSAPHEPWFKAPGYSWLVAGALAVAGEGWPWALRLLQHGAGALLAPVAGAMASGMAPAKLRRRASAVAAGLVAVYGPMIRLESNISLDFWAVFFQSVMLMMLARWSVSPRHRHRVRWLMMAGGLAAAAWLTRPTITLILPVLVGWIAVVSLTAGCGRRGEFPMAKLTGSIACFLLPVIIAMAGSAARNAWAGGEMMIMPWQGGYNFYEANRPGASGRYLLQKEQVNTTDANPTRALAIQGYVASLSPDAAAEFMRAPQYGAVNSYWFTRTVDSIKGAPGAWLGLMVRKAVYLLSDKEIFNYEDYDLQRSLSSILPWLPGRFGVIFPLGLVSLVAWPAMRGGRRKAYLLAWIYIVSLGGAISLYYVSGRMRMPIALPLIALAGIGAATFPVMSGRGKGLAAVLAIGGITISWGDWWGVRSESMAHADLARMSNAAWHRNRFEQALDFALRAEKAAPGYPVIPRLKAQAYYGLGMLPDSAAAFEESVRVLGDETSRRNLQVVRDEMTSRGILK